MKLKQLVRIIIFLFAISGMGMAYVDIYIQNPTTPMGIVSFEFIKTLDNADRARHAWSEEGKAATGISLGLDYLFIFSYVTLMLVYAHRLNEKAKLKIFPVLGITTALVGSFDFVENVSLIKLLLGSQNQLWPQLAYVCATCKFSGAVIYTVMYLVAYGLICLRKKSGGLKKLGD